MDIRIKQLKPGVCLAACKTDKFKSNYVSINFIQPLSKDNAAAFSLLSRVLKRGCKKYKNQKEIKQ